ncbi:sulfiredoxin, chloroplastic/mitochondrial isoform X2 [Zea mays]|uniref:sulfiredoxin, chloroplastic/mitochondrial isoform X2 n=1 Tax=Zea mays TaxID=4577 RepID=UPI0016533279|nr:sulfiredoxin, chloroplastic/mitochondrial isoform X2 [Zea mays]
MASSSTLDLAMGPGALLPRSAVPYASFAPGRGRSASGTRSRNLALSASSSNGAAVPSLTTDSEKKGPVIMEIPLDQIRRPLMRTRANDPVKVQELMDSIRVIGLQVPFLDYCRLMCWRSMGSIMASLDATATRLTSALVSQPSAAKFAVGQRKH